MPMLPGGPPMGAPPVDPMMMGAPMGAPPMGMAPPPSPFPSLDPAVMLQAMAPAAMVAQQDAAQFEAQQQDAMQTAIGVLIQQLQSQPSPAAIGAMSEPMVPPDMGEAEMDDPALMGGGY